MMYATGVTSRISDVHEGRSDAWAFTSPAACNELKVVHTVLWCHNDPGNRVKPFWRGVGRNGRCSCSDL